MNKEKLNIFKYALLPIFLYLNHCLMAFEPAIILVGPPGSGKGSFSQYLHTHYGYHHISIGDLLRIEVEQQTELGREIEELIRKGDYVDSTIIHNILDKTIRTYQMSGSPFILDGFGRIKEDVDVMHRLLQETDQYKRTYIVFLEASDSLCEERINHRLICPGCKFIYNDLTFKPLITNVCNCCGVELIERLNDSPEVIKKRLFNYRKNVEHSYKYGTTLFPTILFCADTPLEECFQFYDHLATETQNWTGDSKAFVEKMKNRKPF